MRRRLIKRLRAAAWYVQQPEHRLARLTRPYNPAMIGKYLTVFRTVANFISVGTDGKTPAVRLGLARQPLTYEDILWPGETAPRPRSVRRKGRRLSGLRRAPRAKARESTGSPKHARP